MNISSGSIYDELTPEQASEALALYQTGGISLEDAAEACLEKDHEFDNGYYCGYITDDEPETLSLDDISIAPGYYD